MFILPYLLMAQLQFGVVLYSQIFISDYLNATLKPGFL